MYSRSYITKCAIMEALAAACETRRYDDVRVVDVCGAIGISKSTFYHYFSDKMAVLEWYAEEAYAKGLDQTGITLTWFEAHLVTTTELARYRSLYLSAATKAKAPLSGYPHRRQKALEHTIVEVKGLRMNAKTRFQIEALSYAEERAILSWFRGEVDVDVKELCDYIVSIIPGELYKLLDPPASSGPAGARGSRPSPFATGRH